MAQTCRDRYQDAFLYSNGTMTDLGTLPGGSYSRQPASMPAGRSWGDADTSSGYDHAFLYSNGIMTDLNTLIPAGWTLTQAEAINDSG